MTGRSDPRLAVRVLAGHALDELREIRSHDPAASAAMRVVRLTTYTVEHFWIPTLDRLDGRRSHEQGREYDDV
jgi:hypothetical protein